MLTRGFAPSGSRSLAHSITRPSVAPCASSVAKITANEATRMKSRPGKPSGTLSASASVTTPRTPAQLKTVAARAPSGSWSPGRSACTTRLIASAAKIQTKRATVSASRIARTCSPTPDAITEKPPLRSSTPRSERPIRMNTAASIRNTITVQNDVPRMRIAAVSTVCWWRLAMMPVVTAAITPDTCTISPSR